MAPETQNIEWKQSWRDEYLKWICGFANAQGGTLEIGKDDRGNVVGVKGVLRLLEEIPAKVQSRLGIVVDVNLKSHSGREYIEIAVEPYPNPISYRGEFHYRSGSTKQVLRGAALSRFLLAKYGRTWNDIPLPGIGLKDLDTRVVDGFLRKAVGCRRLPEDAVDEPIEILVENLELRDGAHLKRAAALLFHSSPRRLMPGAYTKIGFFREAELLFQNEVEGDLFTQVDRVMDLLYTKYSLGLVSYDDIYRIETYPVPREAMREAIINAVIHRDYASPAPIQIRVYDDLIEIWNAAHLNPGWTDDLLAGKISSRPPNPLIANAFFRAGMIEAWGRGIRRIVNICREAGNPAPTWRLDAGADGLWVEFPFAESYLTAYAAARGSAAEGTSPGTNQKQSRSTLRYTFEQIVQSLWAEPRLSQAALAERVGLSLDGVENHLQNMIAAGIIRRVGSDRAERWEVLR